MLIRARSPVWNEYLSWRVMIDERDMSDPTDRTLREIKGVKRRWNLWGFIKTLKI